MIINTAQLHSFKKKLNSGYGQVQILLKTCQIFAMVRISDNSPSWIEGFTPFPLSQSTKTIHHNYIKLNFLKIKILKVRQQTKKKNKNRNRKGDRRFFLTFFYYYWDSHSMQGWTATTWHGVTRKRSTKRLEYTVNLFRKNLQLKDN